MPITQSLSVGDISDFSEKIINKLLTSEDCFRLFFAGLVTFVLVFAVCEAGWVFHGSSHQIKEQLNISRTFISQSSFK